MTSAAAVLKRRSLRFRITATFVLASAVLAGVLSVTTLLTVRRFLEEQRIRSSTRQTLFAVLFAREFLASRPDAAELVTKLQIRQNFDAMVTQRDEWFSTSLELTPDLVPQRLRSLVDGEALGYEHSTLGGTRRLVYGTPLPPRGLDLFLFFPMEDIDDTVTILARVLAVAGIVVVGITLVSARRVGARILHPLSAVSGAAQRMAEGLLETRVETVSADELGQLAASFNRMAEALHEIIQRDRRFVAAVSHELRTPLAALNAASEVISRYRDKLPSDGREALDLHGEDLASLRQLVEELMELSELDSGRPVVRKEEVRLRPFVQSLLKRRHRDAEIEGGDPVVDTDKARLERIVGNLIDNAFSHGEGRDVRVLLEVDGDTCSVTIADRGPGIDPADRSRLFDRFYKADRSRSRDRGGVGLGLAIASENAKILGGSLDVSSSGEPGAAFTLRLPWQASLGGEDP